MFTQLLVSRVEFCEMCDAVEQQLEELGYCSPTSFDILKEMRLCASYNHEFRNTTFPELEEFFQELYEELHD